MENSFSGDPSRFSDLSGGASSKSKSGIAFSTVKRIIRDHCADCHSDFLSRTEDQWIADTYLVTAGDSHCSRFFYRINGSGASCTSLAGVAQDMPRGSSVAASDIATLSQWINGLDATGSTDNSATGRRLQALEVLSTHCYECHNVNQVAVSGDFSGATVYAFSSFTTDNEFVQSGLVLSGNTEDSWIYRVLKTWGDIATMPKNHAAISELEKYKINNWISQIGDP